MAAVKKPTPKKGVAKAAARAPATSGAAPGRRSTSYTGPRDPHLTADVTTAVVDEVPPQTHSTMTFAYARKLAEVREMVGAGRTVMIAEFVSKSGASRVRVKLERGETPVDGEVEDWEFASRRVMGVDGVGSRLYATLRE